MNLTTLTPASGGTAVLRHAAALGLVAACCLGRWLVDPLFGGKLAMLPAAAATVIAARWLGAGPGMVACVVGLVAGDLLFARPRIGWAAMLVRDAGSLAVAGLVGLLVVWTVTRLRNQADRLGREIAIRRRTEVEMEAARRRFEQFLDAAPVCAFVKDADGRFVYLNRHIREAYPELATGSTVDEMFPAHQAAEFTRNDDWVRRTGESVACEEVATGSDAVVRHWATSKFPVFDENGRRGVGGISIEITDRKRATEQVTRSETLLRRLIDVQEQEKRILCHEVHDGLMQYAIAGRMMLESWRQGRPDAEAAPIDEVIRCLDAGIHDGRQTIRGIRPAVLDDLGLKAAIDEFADGLAGTGPAIDVAVDPDVDRAPPTIQTTAFRIIQEATANARKHSGSDRVQIRVRITGDQLVVEVQDFGRGFDTASPPHTGFGIVGMTERARLVGGSCAIQSVPGRGTVVTACLPAATDERAAALPPPATPSDVVGEPAKPDIGCSI